MSKIIRFLFFPSNRTFIPKYLFCCLSRLPCLHGLFTPVLPHGVFARVHEDELPCLHGLFTAVLPHGVFARVDEDELTHCPRADVEDVLA